jgi:flagellar protein FliO/FliZ
MFGILLRMVLAMAVVIGIMYVAARVFRTKMLTTKQKTSGSVDMEVIARQPLSRAASLVLTHIGSKFLVLGVTDHSVNTITEVDVVDLKDGLNADWTTHSGDELIDRSDSSRKGMIEQLREMTARRA